MAIRSLRHAEGGVVCPRVGRLIKRVRKRRSARALIYKFAGGEGWDLVGVWVLECGMKHRKTIKEHAAH